MYEDQARAPQGHWACVGRAFVGPPGPLWAPMGPCGPVPCGPLGPCGLGT